MKSRHTDSRSRPAFTLVELLVVIAIIAMLVTLLLPAVQAARAAARRAQCSNQIRQLVLACMNNESAQSHFPAGSVNKDMADITECGGGDGPGGPPWTVRVLPYTEDVALFDLFDMDAKFTSTTNVPGSPRNHAVFLEENPAYKCPSDPLTGLETNYITYFGVQGGGAEPRCTSQANSRQFFDNGVMYVNAAVPIQRITDGTSKTWLIGETRYCDQTVSFTRTDGKRDGWCGWASSAKKGTWALPMVLAAAVEPINAFAHRDVDPTLVKTLDIQTRLFGSHHTGGAHFGAADGSVAMVSDDIDVAAYYQMAVRNDQMRLDWTARPNRGDRPPGQ